MRLIVDASVLVGEALRTRGRDLLEHPLLDLVIADEKSLEMILANVSLTAPEVYAERLTEARERLPRDARDAPTLALALTLDCGIWTADRDFFGCGVPVWSTEVLLWYVRC